MTELEAIVLMRAEEQLRDERTWRLGRYGHDRDSWDVQNIKDPPEPTPRAHCFACSRTPTVKGSLAGYCAIHAHRVSSYGVVHAQHDFLTYEESRR